MGFRISPERKAALLCVVVNLMETLSGSCAQGLQDHIPPFQLNVFRYSTQFLICAVLVCILGLRLKMDYPEVIPTLMVCLCIMLYNLGLYTAAAWLPLGILTVLLNVTQTIAAIVFQLVLLNGSVPVLKVAILPFTFLGLFLMVQPSVWSEHVVLTTHYLQGIMLVTMAGISLTLAATVIKRKCQNINVIVLGFWYTITGTIASILLSIYLERCQTTLTLRQGLFLLGHSIGAATAGMVALFYYKHIQLITWAVINSSRIVLNFVLQYTIMSAFVQVTGSVQVYIGMAITLIGIIYVVGYDLSTEGINDTL